MNTLEKKYLKLININQIYDNIKYQDIFSYLSDESNLYKICECLYNWTQKSKTIQFINLEKENNIIGCVCKFSLGYRICVSTIQVKFIDYFGTLRHKKYDIFVIYYTGIHPNKIQYGFMEANKRKFNYQNMIERIEIKFPFELDTIKTFYNEIYASNEIM